MYIYKITNLINNKAYIGLTSKTIELRFRQHKSTKTKYAIHKAFEKYGVENFEISLLASCDTREEACSLEQFYISKYKTFDTNLGYNLTKGGEHTNGDSHPRATLKDEDVVKIRMFRKEGHKCKNVYKFYENALAFSTFEKIWLGTSWTHIGMNLIQGLPINHSHKKHTGQDNGNALLMDNEVLKIRLFYITHTLDETYAKFGERYKNKTSFRRILDSSYSHLPIYSKVKKMWLLNGKEVNINDYTTPVSTISVSGE